MKKIILLTVLLLSLMTVPVFAAGSISASYAKVGEYQTTMIVTITFTADASDGTIPDLTLGANVVGWNLYQVILKGNSGGTEVTEDSDFYIYQDGVDILDGNGEDQLDNTANRNVYPQIDGTPASPPITSDLTVTITQATAVTNSATGTIKLVFYK